MSAFPSGTRAICGVGSICLETWGGVLEVWTVSNLSSSGKVSLVGRGFCWAEFFFLFVSFSFVLFYSGLFDGIKQSRT